MRKPFFEYSRDRTSKSIYESLNKEEQGIIDNFKDEMLITASIKRCDEAKREVLRFREVTGNSLENVSLKDLNYFLKELMNYKKEDDIKLADFTLNKVKSFVKRFLKFQYPNNDLRFNYYKTVVFNNDAGRKNEINSDTILTEEEIEKLIKHEKSLFFKCFLKIQASTGMRTGEVRSLKWNSITFGEDGFCSFKIISKKNRYGKEKARQFPLSKEATYYLLKLKDQYKNNYIETEWVFPSPKNPSKHISKSVNEWFRKLTLEVLGYSVINYSLRHGKAASLKKLISENKLSKSNALTLMGHSEEMFDKIYSEMDEEEKLEIMKEQLYGFKPLTEKENNQIKELGLKLKNQNKEIQEIKKILQDYRFFVKHGKLDEKNLLNI